MKPEANSFNAADFIVLTSTLLVSTMVGVFFAYKDRNNQSTENYYFGSRKISPVPVAASLSVSFVSAIAVIGLPVEVYLFGTVFAWNIVAQLFSTLIAIFFYIPVFHRLQLKSVYEYLELRFNRVVRLLASTIAIISLFLYLGIVIYMPALALSAVTPLKLEWSIVLTSSICTFYTTIGGMKAVIWTDVVQAVIMIAGMLGVFIQGVLTVGGFQAIAAASERGERSNFLRFDIDPRIRSTAWTVGLGLGLNSCYETGCNQVYIQRYLSCRTVTTARLALLLTLIPGFLFTLLSVGNGLALYTYYEGCDPFLSGRILKVDQSMARFSVDIFENTFGMAGLFVSAAYCGTLSSVSSGINAMAALALVDFVNPRFPALSSKKRIVISKALSVTFGIFAMVLAYVISLTSSNIIQVTGSIAGFVGGPMIGVFTMGLFMPWINSKGALAGIIFGWTFIGWIGLSAMYATGLYPETTKKLPLYVESCNASLLFDNVPLNYTTAVGITTFSPTTNDVQVHQHSAAVNSTLYSISPFLYGVFGFLVCIISGNVVSVVTGCNKFSKIDRRLLVPVFSICFPDFEAKNDEHQMTVRGQPLPSMLLLTSAKPDQKLRNSEYLECVRS